eukprot:1146330-Pelagomonas_calceolata.AAC.10
MGGHVRADGQLRGLHEQLPQRKGARLYRVALAGNLVTNKDKAQNGLRCDRHSTLRSLSPKPWPPC